MPDEEPDRHPVRSLFISLAAGMLIFDGALFLILALLSYGHSLPDSSVDDFYFLLTFCGLLFGFERWWYHDSGGVNPFHNK